MDQTAFVDVLQTQEGLVSQADRLQKTGAAVLPVSADDLAPERARDPRRSDIRADIYALGCVLYHCLTGQPPFPDASPVAQLIRHATEAPRPLRQFDAALPRGLQRVMDRLLAKDPAQRYPTPESAARALREFLPLDPAGPRGVPEGPRRKPGQGAPLPGRRQGFADLGV